MVNELHLTHPRRPGLAFWLLSLVALPPVGVVLTLAVILSRNAFSADVWLLSGAGVVALGAVGVAWLPRGAGMARRAHAAWAAAGGAIVLALTAGEVAGLYVLAMTAACGAGGNCL
jgi:hypothetical protein